MWRWTVVWLGVVVGHMCHDFEPTPSASEDAPWFASYGDACAGAIVTKQWVVTAAYCSPNRQVVFVPAVAGQVQMYDVANHFVHPLHNSYGEGSYNIKLLLLQIPIQSNDVAKPIRLQRHDDIENQETTVYVHMWVKSMKCCGRVLTETTFNIMNSNKCQKKIEKEINRDLKSQLFCGKRSTGQKLQDFDCNMVRGSPAVARGSKPTLLGIMNSGEKCGLKYATFVSIPKSVEWIRNIIKTTKAQREDTD